MSLAYKERIALKLAISDARRQLTGAKADGIKHGTHWAYRCGCRCDVCREQQRIDRAGRRNREQLSRLVQPYHRRNK